MVKNFTLRRHGVRLSITEVDSTHNRNAAQNLANSRIHPNIQKSPRLVKLDNLELPVGCILIWKDCNGFDDNWFSSLVPA